ncbi:MAG: TrmH family RNA methyltransferase [Chitinophagales bacterium]
MSPRRQEKFWRVIDKIQPDVTVIIEDVIDSHNISAVLRSCDAVGIKDVYIVHNARTTYCKIDKHLRMGQKVSGRIMKWMNIHYFDSIATCFEVVRQKYDKIYTTHLSDASVSLYDMDLTESVALVFGNELAGISPEALELSDGNFIIPQVGMTQSLNISVACAVTLFEFYRQREKAGKYDAPLLDQTTRQEIFDEWAKK